MRLMTETDVAEWQALPDDERERCLNATFLLTMADLAKPLYLLAEMYGGATLSPGTSVQVAAGLRIGCRRLRVLLEQIEDFGSRQRPFDPEALARYGDRVRALEVVVDALDHKAAR